MTKSKTKIGRQEHHHTSETFQRHHARLLPYPDDLPLGRKTKATGGEKSLLYSCLPASDLGQALVVEG